MFITAILLQKTITKAVAKTPAAAPHHIRKFFAKYPTFEYNVRAPFLDEFRRLCKHMKWKDTRPRERAPRESTPRERASAELSVAMVKQFGRTYGCDANNLASWQQLCRALGGDVPKEIEGCKQLLSCTHVNLVDFIQAPDTANSLQTFPTEVDLSEYTKQYQKYFPREAVKAGSLLECLLRHIILPRPPENLEVTNVSEAGVGLG